MSGSESNALWRHQIKKWIVFGRQVFMYSLHDFIGGMRSGHRKYIRVGLFNDVTFCTETAGDNDFAVFIKCFADSLQRFFNSGIYKTAGINHHQIGSLISGAHNVTFGAKLCENVL